MSVSQKGAKRLLSGGSSIVLSRDTVCSSCLSRLAHQSRRYAATAAATADQSSSTQQQPPIAPVTVTSPRKAYRVLASPVISRPPLLTRELNSFEKAFYLYQKRLNERLALPFSRYFYYKKGTPGDLEWKRRARSRKSAARDIGQYSGYGDEAWHDEVLTGDKTAEPSNLIEALIRDAEGNDIVDNEAAGDAETGREAVGGDATRGEGARKPVGQDVKVEKPLSRVTEADRQNDLRSLNRKLDRTLYLLVQNKNGSWRFPEDRVYGRENLHQAAERTIIQALGINMNTWVVGNHPVGHHAANFREMVKSKISPNALVPTAAAAFEQEEFGEKVFFMKSRIMGGKPDLSKNEFGDKEFRWLAKEEVQQIVHPQYWSSVRHMLVER